MSRQSCPTAVWIAGTTRSQAPCHEDRFDRVNELPASSRDEHCGYPPTIMQR